MDHGKTRSWLCAPVNACEQSKVPPGLLKSTSAEKAEMAEDFCGGQTLLLDSSKSLCKKGTPHWRSASVKLLSKSRTQTSIST